MNVTRPVVFLPLALAAGVAAADTVALPESPWKAASDIGYIRSSGSNGTKETFKGKVFGEYKFTKWSHEGKVEAISTQDDAAGASNTERYLAGTKSKRSFNPRDYLFIQSQWEKDLQSEFKYQAFLSSGYGRNLIQTDSQKLSAEIGAGWRHSEPKIGYKKDEGIGNANVEYRWQIQANTAFVQKVAVEAGKENVVTRSLTEIKHNLSTALALGASYDYKHDNADVNTHEGVLSLNLSYVFR